MAATGILSQKTFFPRTGDVLDDLEDGISWECVRAHSYKDAKTGRDLRYALLVGRHPEMDDRPIPRLVDDSTIPLPMLKSINVVHRERNGEMVRYRKNEKGNYEE